MGGMHNNSASHDAVGDPQASTFVRQQLNLDVDGSTPTTVSITSANFSYVSRIIFELAFTDNTLEYTDFAGGVALTNGIEIMYNGSAITPAMKTNGDFGKVSYDVQVLTDEDAGTKTRLLLCRVSFNKVVPRGLDVRNGEAFGVKISDNLTASPAYDSITSFTAEVQGYL